MVLGAGVPEFTRALRAPAPPAAPGTRRRHDRRGAGPLAAVTAGAEQGAVLLQGKRRAGMEGEVGVGEPCGDGLGLQLEEPG